MIDVLIFMWFYLPEFNFLEHNSKMTGDCSFFKFLQCRVDYLMLFQGKNAVFKFLLHSVEATLYSLIIALKISLPIHTSTILTQAWLTHMGN